MCGGASGQQTQGGTAGPYIYDQGTGYTTFDQGTTYKQDPNTHLVYGGDYYYVPEGQDVGSPSIKTTDLNPTGQEGVASGVEYSVVLPESWQADTMAGWHAAYDPTGKSNSSSSIDFTAEFQSWLDQYFAGYASSGGSSGGSSSGSQGASAAEAQAAADAAAADDEARRSMQRGVAATTKTGSLGLADTAPTMKTALGA